MARARESVQDKSLPITSSGGNGVIFDRRVFLSRAGACLAAGTLGIRPALADNNISKGQRGNDEILKRLVSITQGPSGKPIVSITFDDGPHPTNTPILLDILKARRIRATFYVIGQNVARYPDLVKRIVDEGHELGNHTWNHPRLTSLGEAGVLSQLDRTSEAIYKAVKKVPVTMRPPYGLLHPSQARMIHAKRAMVTTRWDVDPRDWQRPGPSVVANRIVSASHNGSIILAHDIHRPTVRAMPSALDGLSGRGFHFSTVSMLLGARDWSRKRFKLVTS